MIRYRFLLKPIFFIFNLVFATWLVLKIEAISPSDFGKYSSIFGGTGKLTPGKKLQKRYLEKIIFEYKHGKLDSVSLNKKLEKYLITPNEVAEEIPK
jgi:hypothetical protein